MHNKYETWYSIVFGSIKSDNAVTDNEKLTTIQPNGILNFHNKGLIEFYSKIYRNISD